MSSVKPPDQPPVLAVIDAARKSWAHELQRRLAAAGFTDQTYAHNNVMAYVDLGGTRLTELAARAGITKQAMGELVTELEGLGYLERVPDPADGRAKLIRFSARGRKAVREAWRAFEAMEAEMDGVLGARRAADFRRALQQVAGMYAGD